MLQSYNEVYIMYKQKEEFYKQHGALNEYFKFLYKSVLRFDRSWYYLFESDLMVRINPKSIVYNKLIDTLKKDEILFFVVPYDKEQSALFEKYNKYYSKITHDMAEFAMNITDDDNSQLDDIVHDVVDRVIHLLCNQLRLNLSLFNKRSDKSYMAAESFEHEVQSKVAADKAYYSGMIRGSSYWIDAQMKTKEYHPEWYENKQNKKDD